MYILHVESTIGFYQTLFPGLISHTLLKVSKKTTSQQTGTTIPRSAMKSNVLTGYICISVIALLDPQF